MEKLENIEKFFAGIPQWTAYVIVGVVVCILIYLGFKYSNFSFKTLNKNL